MTREQNEKAVKKVLMEIKIKKMMSIILNVVLVAFVIFLSFFICKYPIEIIALAALFFPLIFILFLLIRGY